MKQWRRQTALPSAELIERDCARVVSRTRLCIPPPPFPPPFWEQLICVTRHSKRAGRAAAVSSTGGEIWSRPAGIQVGPLLAARVVCRNSIRADAAPCVCRLPGYRALAHHRSRWPGVRRGRRDSCRRCTASSAAECTSFRSSRGARHCCARPRVSWGAILDVCRFNSIRCDS